MYKTIYIPIYITIYISIDITVTIYITIQKLFNYTCIRFAQFETFSASI